MAPLKEPHFLSTDLPGLREVETDDAYMALFEDGGMRLCGEASASYLYSRAAIPAAVARNSAARVIVLLRNPVDAAHALHQELTYNLSESETDFPRAWQLQEARQQGHHIPRSCREPAMLQYRAVYRYADQIPRLLECVPAHQVLVLLFDTLTANPRDVYERVLSLLGVEDDGRDTFPRVNAAKSLRSRALSQAHRSGPPVLGPLYRPMKRAANAMGLYPSHLLARWNVASRQRAPLSASFRRELLVEFEPDIRAVEETVARSLPEWRACGTDGEGDG